MNIEQSMHCLRRHYEQEASALVTAAFAESAGSTETLELLYLACQDYAVRASRRGGSFALAFTLMFLACHLNMEERLAEDADNPAWQDMVLPTDEAEKGDGHE